MRKLVNMRLPADLLERVDAEAERLGQTRTKFVERALVMLLEVMESSPVEKESAARPSKGGDMTSRGLSSGSHAAPSRPASGKPSIRDTWSR